MVKWLMTGPYSQPKQKSSGHRRKRRWEITYSETKGLEQFPKDKAELGEMIDK